MKTITYNHETHALVPREPSEEMLQAALRANMQHVIDCINDPAKSKDIGSEETCKQTYRSRYASMIAAAPQPEPNHNWCAGCSPDNCSGCGADPVDVGSVGWKHDCAALCANDIELWIDRCPHCGKPRHNHPPTDDELLNKAEQVESEPVDWCLAYDDPVGYVGYGDRVEWYKKPAPETDLYTTPQPDRTAELEAALKVARDALIAYSNGASGAIATINEVLK